MKKRKWIYVCIRETGGTWEIAIGSASSPIVARNLTTAEVGTFITNGLSDPKSAFLKQKTSPWVKAECEVVKIEGSQRLQVEPGWYVYGRLINRHGHVHLSKRGNYPERGPHPTEAEARRIAREWIERQDLSSPDKI